MMKNALFVFILHLIGTTLLIAQNQSANNISYKNKSVHQKNTNIIQDNEVVIPEILNENIDSLLVNWQISFSNSDDDDCVQGINIDFNDSIYTQRLYNLPTEIELSFNPIVYSYINRYANRSRNLVSYMLSLGEYYYPIFEEVLDKYGLPLELKYLPIIESALNPVAVSRMGATGLWQFMLRTGKQYNLEINSLVDERRDPYKSTEAAAKFLKDLYNIYGDWNLAIAAYNCGPGNVNKAIARSHGKRDYWTIYYKLPRETRGYLPAFIATAYIMNYNDEHRICPKQSDRDLMFLDTVSVSNQIHFNQIAEVLDIPLEDIRRYNPQFKRDIIPGNHKPYTLVLPTKSIYAFIDRYDEIINYNKATYFTHRKNTLTDHYSSDANHSNVYYSVKKGDTLGAIARRNRTSVKRLQRMNGLKNTRLSIGQKLIVKQIPKPVETKENVASDEKLKNTYYKIKSGDTLDAIAEKNGTTVAHLKKMNDMHSLQLVVGEHIIVKQEKGISRNNQPEKNTVANKRLMYPKIDISSISSSETILKEYMEKVKVGSSNFNSL